MAGKSPNEPWYALYAEHYGIEAAIEAGYFHETRPWKQSYESCIGAEKLKAPKEIKTILQFSGAFWPFHDGHFNVIQAAINYLDRPILVILHVDHAEYRLSKGVFNDQDFRRSFDSLINLKSKRKLETRLIFEDHMPEGCSRNFTRLYSELCALNPLSTVWFLAGGDRASFCLAFKDRGNCLIIGRDRSPAYSQYCKLQNERIIFLPGYNPQSSSQIRSQVILKKHTHDIKNEN